MNAVPVCDISYETAMLTNGSLDLIWRLLCNAVITCEIMFNVQKLFSFRGCPHEVILFQHVEICLKCFPNSFRECALLAVSQELLRVFVHYRHMTLCHSARIVNWIFDWKELLSSIMCTSVTLCQSHMYCCCHTYVLSSVYVKQNLSVCQCVYTCVCSRRYRGSVLNMHRR